MCLHLADTWHFDSTDSPCTTTFARVAALPMKLLA